MAMHLFDKSYAGQLLHFIETGELSDWVLNAPPNKRAVVERDFRKVALRYNSQKINGVPVLHQRTGPFNVNKPVLLRENFKDAFNKAHKDEEDRCRTRYGTVQQVLLDYVCPNVKKCADLWWKECSPCFKESTARTAAGDAAVRRRSHMPVRQLVKNLQDLEGPTPSTPDVFPPMDTPSSGPPEVAREIVADPYRTPMLTRSKARARPPVHSSPFVTDSQGKPGILQNFFIKASTKASWAGQNEFNFVMQLHDWRTRMVFGTATKTDCLGTSCLSHFLTHTDAHAQAIANTVQGTSDIKRVVFMPTYFTNYMITAVQDMLVALCRNGGVPTLIRAPLGHPEITVATKLEKTIRRSLVANGPDPQGDVLPEHWPALLPCVLHAVNIDLDSRKAQPPYSTVYLLDLDVLLDIEAGI